MARSIPTGMAGVLEKLELERPQLITTRDLESICIEEEVATPARIVAARLRDHGWLLPTAQRGVWEFAPAELAGAFSSADPLLDLKAFALANPGAEFAVAAHTAAWALGLADRVPATLDVAFDKRPTVKVPDGVSFTTFSPNLERRHAKGVPVLSPESIIVCMSAKPASVRSWASAVEWLPDVAYEIQSHALLEELRGRRPAVWAKVGYLLQGMRPDASETIERVFTPSSKVRFGSSGNSHRNDERWKVADELLPFDPREMGAVR